MIGLWTKIKIGLGIAGAVIVAIGIAFLKGRRAGIEHIEAEQQKRRDNLQEHYDEIDRQAIDPAGSYDRLRGMSDDAHGR
ncbi:hypothetical protein ASD04_15015 [Devosia sp. Root436]|uniref:hypothetical protein n=1 Tax=Devosia sp. Root436 TaxID=1736537 RepID=UPI0006FC4A8D|nr:hypothetical protein [Devosia sp. Root436]KQX35348.1 hypothetical protein ASD04_15015 [Devosia sp. Root436]